LENEIETYWKQFIPNKKFYDVLSQTLNSLETDRVEEKQSIWLQGTYGTGKSHATAVIKHLLFDDWNKINDFIENIDDAQIKFKLKNFRENKKVFPVVLKATSSITDNRSFALVIERAVKECLRKRGIALSTKSDFEKMIHQVTKNPANIDWESNIENSELRFYVNTKEDLINKLKQGDIDILKKLEEIYSEKGINFFNEDIGKWLVEIKNELKNKNISDYLMIYWDEFTGVLELPKSGLLLTELQNIAELSITEGVYLFVVSHRKPYQSNISKRDVEKILGRFKLLDYSMEPITTYHIVSAAIKKTDRDRWNEMKTKYVEVVRPLITNIIGNESINVQKSLENLFPIHPYTAYLATFIARNIGSTERSIFKFLYDENNGFKKFIKINPGENGQVFLTPDYLWDFFYEEFERSGGEKCSPATERFKLHKETLEEKEKTYLIVFKSILLLNVLYKFAEVSEEALVAPTIENIKNLFAGTIDDKHLEDILHFIDEQQIISKTPDDLYLITGSSLPFREIEEEKRKIYKEYENINKILYETHEKEIKNVLSNSVSREEIEIAIFDANLKEYTIRNKIEKAFKKDYSIHLCVFLGRNVQEIQQIKDILRKISNDDDLENIIFVVSDVPLNESIFNKFLEYKARARVADKHNYNEEININENYANKIIDEWLNNVKTGYIEWFLKNDTGKELLYQFNEKINKELSQKIFKYGLDNLKKAQNLNLWKSESSQKSVEIFLFADNREDIEQRTKGSLWAHLREIIKDINGEYIVDHNLNFKEDVPDDHPVKKMYLEINKAIEEHKNKGTFNLADVLDFLKKPPYGLYKNKISMATLGFLMGKYVGKLYEAGTGRPIQKEMMRDKILELFGFWSGGKGNEKLEVRFGTEEETKLIELLKDIFKLEKVESLNDVRWKIRDWIKDAGFPIWVFKLSENINENAKNAIDSIFNLIQSIDKELTYNKVKEYLENIEKVKFDLQLHIKKQNAENLFKQWLQNIESIKISSDEDIQEIINYIRNTMQEEVASWTEYKVRDKIKNWYIQKLEKSTPSDKVIIEPSSEPYLKTSIESYLETNRREKNIIEKEEKENIKNKIIMCDGEKVKQILIGLVNNCPNNVVRFIKKCLEEF